MDVKICENSTSQEFSSTLGKYALLFHGDLEKTSRVAYCLTDLREKRKKIKKKKTSVWNYEKDAYLLNYILLELQLDSNQILQDMSNQRITIEEAIRHQIFLQTSEKRENGWLEELYNYLIDEINIKKNEQQAVEDIIGQYESMMVKYHLTLEEQQIINKAFSKYLKVMKEYQILDVGLETDEEKKLEKIKNYNLDQEDIEESYFVPLEFDQGTLLERKSKLYQRRQLLRQYIMIGTIIQSKKNKKQS